MSVAIVTGGARGIGAAIALRLAQDGHDVATVDLDSAACADIAAVIEARGVSTCTARADVSDFDACEAAVAEITEALGPPTILVNNAGLMREGTLRRSTVDDWRQSINVNLAGAWNMCKAAQQGMRDAGTGRIVNLTSTGALGETGLSAYSAAKAGLHGLTKSLSVELGRFGITVNAIAPGLTLTPMIESMSDRIGEGMDHMESTALAGIPMGRLGTPEDIAHAVSFFCDPRSDFVSGQILYVTGGPKC